MLQINVLFFNMSFEFVQTLNFVQSVNRLLNARYKERYWLLSKSLTNDWLHLGVWCKFLPS